MLAELITQLRDSGRDLESIEDRLYLIELISSLKMTQEGKIRWGLKCSNQFEEYLKVWPEAYMINIIRDGRDVLASQLNTGNFNLSPTETGRGWSTTHLKFRALVENPEVNALEVLYERLVTNPAVEINRICDFLGIDYDEQMMSFHQQDLSIFNNPAGHLSLNRISKPIDVSKIGRWKQELSSQQLDEFYSIAGTAMELFGYLDD